MADRTDSIGDNNANIFNIQSGGVSFSWRYGFHDAIAIVRDFLFGRRNPRTDNEIFTDTAQTIVLQGEVTPDAIENSRHLLEQQRMLEDTKARRRLERWATRVISWYLIIVLLLVVANGMLAAFSPNTAFISSGIMIAILTTTTINIIGLGLIVLKGHFPSKKDINMERNY